VPAEGPNRVTVTNSTSTTYTLVGSDPLCDSGQFAFEAPGEFSTQRTLGPNSSVVYYCQIDAIDDAGLPGDSIPDTATRGNGPFPLTNTVTIVTTDPSNNSVTLTDSVTANFN
jgi:hypothetical protein